MYGVAIRAEHGIDQGSHLLENLVSAQISRITLERLKELLIYEPETGIFTAKVNRKGSAKIGERVGTFTPRDGLVDRLDGKIYPMHNLAWLWVHGEWPAKQLLKLDGNNANLSIKNLAMPSTTARGELTQDRLKEVLRYDAPTGQLVWRIRPAKNVEAGSAAGRYEKTTGYNYISVDGTDYTAQRLVWLYEYGELPERPLRFLDGNPNNLHIENLALPEFDARTAEGKIAYQRDYRRRSFTVCKGIDLRKDFGIDLDVYNLMLKFQGGVCAICKRPETAIRSGKVKWMAVDHCHSSMRIRGLLCQTCNSMLGQAKDDAARLRAGADYVEKDHAIEIDGEPVYIMKKGNR